MFRVEVSGFIRLYALLQALIAAAAFTPCSPGQARKLEDGLAAAIHASIGLRQIAREWTRLRGAVLNAAAIVAGAGLAALGLRAVYAVVAG